MSWTSFHCEDADFTIRSVPDDVSFGVRRSSLQNSQVFRDMFICCDGPNTSADSQTLDLNEPSQLVIVLLRLLHDPLEPPVEAPGSEEVDLSSSQLPRKRYDLSTVVPLPLLTTVVFDVVDKYMLDPSIIDTVWLHVKAHAATDPLEVYSFATLHDQLGIAGKASQYAMPLASYRTDAIKVIPSVEAYHRLVQVQDLRLAIIKKILLSENLFPHGYGKCPVHDASRAAIWDAQRKALAIRVNIGTDVAAEMATISQEFRDCEQCFKAFRAAVEMLAYKTRKATRRTDQLVGRFGESEASIM